MRDVAELGSGSVKLWLSYIELGIMAEDDVALAVMQEAGELGMVVLAHCENGRAVDLLTRQLVAQGRLGLDSLPRSRPIAFEAECVHRFLALAEVAGATPYVVHVTGRHPLEEIAAARARGMTVYAEVCSHHLLFERAEHEGPDALRYVMTPPLRTTADRVALVRGLRDGGLDTYSWDHCHLRLDRDMAPVAHDFARCPRVWRASALDFGTLVDGGWSSPERFVEVALRRAALRRLPARGGASPRAQDRTSVRHPAAVDHHVRAAHVGAVVGGQEDRQRRDVLGPAEAREGRARVRVGERLGRVRLVDRRRQDLARRDRVADDPARPEVDGDLARAG